MRTALASRSRGGTVGGVPSIDIRNAFEELRDGFYALTAGVENIARKAGISTSGSGNAAVPSHVTAQILAGAEGPPTLPDLRRILAKPD